ncbi:transmembrane protein 223 [Eucyclogobius newberryi]|uniref:transmembrane protein 223 n=1 Tax=Eucyclogobius newberryi TaxID=166745 RepID=UPI003B5B796A
MGLERLVCISSRCFYSTQFRLLNAHQNVFRNALAQSLPIKNTREWLCSRFVGVVKRQEARLCTSASQISRDVTLFDHDRTRFFRLLSIFCGGQFVFWTYLAQFAYTGLRDTSGSEVDKTKTQATPTKTTGLAGMWSVEMNLGSNAWRFGFTAGCLAIGAGIVGLGFLFCRRSVNQVILHQGGKMVTVRTQSPLAPGKGRKLTVPLSQVACYAHRQESSSFIPLRVKGHKFYFLLDKDGTVTNAKLFDITVGAYRVI